VLAFRFERRSLASKSVVQHSRSRNLVSCHREVHTLIDRQPRFHLNDRWHFDERHFNLPKRDLHTEIPNFNKIPYLGSKEQSACHGFVVENKGFFAEKWGTNFCARKQ
jgi:hypothetical protein